MAFWSSGLPTISPTAKNMPRDSTITTTMTRHMVRIGVISKRGRPNWKGRTRLNQDAVCTCSKLILPRKVARTQPKMAPIRMAQLLSRPLVKRVSSSTTTSTARDTAR